MFQVASGIEARYSSTLLKKDLYIYRFICFGYRCCFYFGDDGDQQLNHSGRWETGDFFSNFFDFCSQIIRKIWNLNEKTTLKILSGILYLSCCEDFLSLNVSFMLFLMIISSTSWCVLIDFFFYFYIISPKNCRKYPNLANSTDSTLDKAMNLLR